MPNWCDNSVRLTNADKSKIDALAASLSSEEKEFFNHLRPNPSGEWQYGWSVENWGTKWEGGIIDWEIQDDNTIWISFDSAWSPPTALYEFLYTEGWEVEAYYHEPGMCFCGRWVDGDDDFYEYDISNLQELEEIPQDIEEFAGLIDYHNSLADDGEFDDVETN